VQRQLARTQSHIKAFRVGVSEISSGATKANFGIDS